MWQYCVWCGARFAETALLVGLWCYGWKQQSRTVSHGVWVWGGARFDDCVGSIVDLCTVTYKSSAAVHETERNRTRWQRSVRLIQALKPRIMMMIVLVVVVMVLMMMTITMTTN